MSPLHKIAVAAVTATFFSSGCCLTCPRSGGHGIGSSCGAEAYGGVVGCSDAGCDSCSGGTARVGGCLGLGCIGKLFSIASYGCTSCGLGNGCGEVYYHDWISDPPCADPCDCGGNWTGATAGGACSGCSGNGCDSCVGEPSCGLAGGGCGGIRGGGCGGISGGGGYGRTGFQLPGRTLYATWMGVGGVFRGIRQGLTPTCATCNAFSFSHNCASCSAPGPTFGSGCNTAGPFYGSASQGPYLGSSGGACSTCSNNVVQGGRVSNVSAGSGRIPHDVVTNQMRLAHNRPPHKVLANRLR